MCVTDIWFCILSAMLGCYVVLDGFDLGAGALHRIVAKDDRQRRTVIAAIGPFWDGNEVFLLAAGGVLFGAFSTVLASALSGLYLAVMLVLWTILLRGISLEFRSHLRDGMWRSLWDVVFQASSGLLALLFGVALGNVLRGFPLERDGYFELDLFSFKSPTRALAVIDGYTLSTGILAVLVLAAHGARFLAMRTDGEVRARSTRIARWLGAPIFGAWILVSALSWLYARDAVNAFVHRPLAWALLVLATVSFVAADVWGRQGKTRRAFLASCGFVLGLVSIAASSAYPVLLRSVTDAPSMTTVNAANDEATLAAGLRWWLPAAILVAVYFANLVRAHRSGISSYGENAEHDAIAPTGDPRA